MKDLQYLTDEMQVASLPNGSNRSFSRLLAGLYWSGQICCCFRICHRKLLHTCFDITSKAELRGNFVLPDSEKQVSADECGGCRLGCMVQRGTGVPR